MFWAAVMWGNRASFWKTMPMDLWCGGTDETGSPWINISPLSGESNPAIIRSSVVFPQPDGPKMVSTDPFGREKPAFLTA